MTLRINPDRLWQNLMAMVEIGPLSKGGCNRQTLSDLDEAGRDLFRSWCRALDLKLTSDAAGNLFARYEGHDPSLAPLVLGSHLDTQPTGGKFDGILGVLAGLETVQVLAEAGIRPERPVEIAVWMNEEGSRFAPAMMGSGVYADMLDLEAVRATKDAEGITVGAELDRHGYAAGPDPRAKDIHAYLELHIEQGPVLEAEGKEIGVVTGAQGIRWYDLTVTGSEAHAGPTPMAMRKDPMNAVPELVEGILTIGRRDADARATIGCFNALPASRNVIPGTLKITVDLRHPSEAELTDMDAVLGALLEDLRAKHPGLGFELVQIWHSPVMEFDRRLVSAIRSGAESRGYSHRDIVSGAGHDALMVALRAPTAMIFTPCRDGISHNEAEHIEPEQAAAGADVLLGAVLDFLEISPRG